MKTQGHVTNATVLVAGGCHRRHRTQLRLQLQHRIKGPSIDQRPATDIQGRSLGLGPDPLGETDEIGVIRRRRMTEIVPKLALIGRNLMKTEQQSQASQT